MIRIIKTNANELANLPYAWAETRIAFHFRKRCGVSVSQTFNVFRKQRFTGNVIDYSGKVAQNPSFIKQSGFFLPSGSS
jgi:hypothetical protein